MLSSSCMSGRFITLLPTSVCWVENSSPCDISFSRLRPVRSGETARLLYYVERRLGETSVLEEGHVQDVEELLALLSRWSVPTRMQDSLNLQDVHWGSEVM